MPTSVPQESFRRAIAATSAATPSPRITNPVDIRWFGATIDGSDDTAAIAAAITEAGPGGSVYFPKGTGNCKISSKLTQLAYQKWFSDGGIGSVILEKAANIDLVDVVDGGSIQNIKIDCKGATYTGRGIHVISGYLQQLRSLDVRDSAGVAIEVGSNAGVGMVIDQIYATTTSPLTVAAIKLPTWFGVGGEPRFLTNLWLSGGFLDMRGVNTGSVVGGYVHHIKTDANSANFYVANIRWASAGAAISIQGTDCEYVNCAFAGHVTFTNCQGISIKNPNFGFGFTEDPATCQYNTLTSNIVAGTSDSAGTGPMTWTQESGTQPALGDGTLVSWFHRHGRLCTIYFKLTIGTTTTLGNNATGWRFSMPFPADLFIVPGQYGIPIRILDVSVPTEYTVWGTIGSNEAFLLLERLGQQVRSDYPFAWAAGDYIEGHFTYIVR